MRTALACLALAVLASPSAAASVDVMVVGRDAVLREAAPVELKRVTVRKRCRAGARTPLAALVRTRLDVSVRDYGSCSKRVRDAGGLYVRAIEGEAERGRDGWVYKVGRRTPSVGAGDPAARMRDGAKLLWFWCRSRAGGCQRSLAVESRRTGDSLTVTVTAYDDNGNGIPAEGATVTLGDSSAVAGADGVAQIAVPAGGGSLVATQPGRVRSFPVAVS